MQRGIMDRVASISKELLVEESLKLPLDKIKFEHFPRELYLSLFDADIIIVFDDEMARVLRNRFSNKRITMYADNIGSYVRSQLYRGWEEGKDGVDEKEGWTKVR
jgi:hypothetical protein